MTTHEKALEAARHMAPGSTLAECAEIADPIITAYISALLPEDVAGLVERLLDISQNDDHERGCQGRQYTCSCGFDDRAFAAADEAATLIQSQAAESAADKARIAELEAERDLLQDILDSRPAINAALPDSYIKWSQAIYSGDAARALLNKEAKG